MSIQYLTISLEQLSLQKLLINDDDLNNEQN